MKRSLAVCVVTALFAACSGRSAPEVKPAIAVQGDVLAKVAGVGEIRQGFAAFGDDDPDVSASEAGPVPEMKGPVDTLYFAEGD